MKQFCSFLVVLMLVLCAQGQNYQRTVLLNGVGARGNVFTGSFATRNAALPELLSVAIDSNGDFNGNVPNTLAHAFLHNSTQPISVTGYVAADVALAESRRVATDFDQDGLTDVISVGRDGIIVNKNISTGDGTDCVFTNVFQGVGMTSARIVQLSDTMWYYVGANLRDVNTYFNFVLVYDRDNDSFSLIGQDTALSPGQIDPLGRGNDRVATAIFGNTISADMNNDGHLDLITTGQNITNFVATSIIHIYTYINGRYVLTSEIPGGLSFGSLSALHYNDDGFLDILATDFGTQILLTNTTTTPGAIPTFSLAENVMDAGRLGDFARVDYQGESLILATGLRPGITGIDSNIPEFADFYRRGETSLERLPNTAFYRGERFNDPRVILETTIGIDPGYASSIEVLDFNNDGLDDFIISGFIGTDVFSVGVNTVVLYLQVAEVPFYLDADNDGVAETLDNPQLFPEGSIQEGYVAIADADLANYALDNCPLANPDQADRNTNGTGDACEALVDFYPDVDADGIADSDVGILELSGIVVDGFIEINVNNGPIVFDNCVGITNQDQADRNTNGIGDACESLVSYYIDRDADGITEDIQNVIQDVPGLDISGYIEIPNISSTYQQDECVNTPAGVAVDIRGCALALPALNFNVTVSNPACPGSLGTVNIENINTVNETYSIEVRSAVFQTNSPVIETASNLQTGTTFNLTEGYGPGTYLVSVFTGSGTNTRLSTSFEFRVAEAPASAENLSLIITEDELKNIHIENPKLPGLFIAINNTLTEIDPAGGDIIVDRALAQSQIAIVGALDCQGKTLLQIANKEIVVYPTLISNETIHITVKNYSGNISVFNTMGQLIWSGLYNQLTPNAFNTGINFMYFEGKPTKELIKIIKQ